MCSKKCLGPCTPHITGASAPTISPVTLPLPSCLSLPPSLYSAPPSPFLPISRALDLSWTICRTAACLWIIWLKVCFLCIRSSVLSLFFFLAHSLSSGTICLFSLSWLTVCLLNYQCLRTICLYSFPGSQSVFWTISVSVLFVFFLFLAHSLSPELSVSPDYLSFFFSWLTVYLLNFQYLRTICLGTFLYSQSVFCTVRLCIIFLYFLSEIVFWAVSVSFLLSFFVFLAHSLPFEFMCLCSLRLLSPLTVSLLNYQCLCFAALFITGSRSVSLLLNVSSFTWTQSVISVYCLTAVCYPSSSPKFLFKLSLLPSIF